MTDWLARPILHVRDVETSLRFYIDQLGFTSLFQYNQDGKVYVAGVERQGCVLILSNTWTDIWPAKIGKGTVFISLNAEPSTAEAGIAAVDALRREFDNKRVTVKEGWWGYRLLVIEDPDGNQLFFNYPDEGAVK